MHHVRAYVQQLREVIGMARQRMVKPEFFDSESLGVCSIAARLAFIGLWVEADDFGRLKWQPTRLKTRIFPYDRMTASKFAGLVAELESAGCVEFYEVDGERYMDVPNFSVYQTVQRPSKSNIPEPPKHGKKRNSMNTHGTLNEHSMNTHAKERKKERSISVSKENTNANELRGAAVGAEAADAAPPSAPPCPKCGGALEKTASKQGRKHVYRCGCGEEVLLDA